MRDLFIKIGLLLQNYTLAQRFIFVFAGVTMLSSMIAILFWANSTEYVSLYSDLSPTEANRIVEELKTDGIDYEISSTGTSISVPDDQVNSLRLRFNRVEYGDQMDGFNVFDKSNIGMTTFMQKVNLQRALEGELTKTINQMQEVKQSRVHLVIPEKRLFEDDESGSASVVLYMESNTYIVTVQVIVSIYAIILFLTLVGLTTYHINLVCRNITTNEDLKGAYSLNKINEHDQGMLKNINSILFSPTPPSKVKEGNNNSMTNPLMNNATSVKKGYDMSAES